MLTRIADAQLIPDALHSVQPWLQQDLLQALRDQAQERGWSLEQCAQRYATVSLPQAKQGWCWHAALGLSRSGSA